jgi:transposase
MRSKAIGIDPDSGGAVCVLVDTTFARVVVQEYTIADDSLHRFVRWVSEQRDAVVALEGRNGQSKPFERALRRAGLTFYSFTAFEVSQFRSAVLGQNKNNERDAEAVARYALALEAQNRLELSRREWFVDEELQTLTRLYSQKRAELTREINRLWKALRRASGDLYLAFRGSHPEFPFTHSLLKAKGVIRLLAAMPDASSWHLISKQELICVTGGPHRGRERLVDSLQLLSAKLGSLSPTTVLLIQSLAEIVWVLITTLGKLEKRLKELTRDNAAVQWLCSQRGIAELTAATMMAEIVDIRRFPTNNHLASYAGLARHEHKTGKSATEIATAVHNHRLKNAFFSAAKNVTLHNPDSHLTAYYNSLLERGMSMTETYKRVGRALARRIYRELKALPETQPTEKPHPTATKEGVMATGSSNREANHAPSDMTPSSLQYTPKPYTVNPKPARPRSAHLKLQVGKRNEDSA